MIVKTLLDTDLYKFTTSYAYIKLFPYAMGTFSFNDRNETQYTEDFLKALKAEIKNLSQLRFTEEELEYMTKDCRFLPRVYWEWLSSFRFDPNKIDIHLDEACHLHIEVTDLLYKVTMPGIIGFSDMWDNVGEVQNKGFELELQSQNLTGSVRWSTSFNMAYNKNEVTDLGNNDKIFSNSNTQVLMVGQPMRSFYMYDAVGVYQYSEDLRKYPVR